MQFVSVTIGRESRAHIYIIISQGSSPMVCSIKKSSIPFWQFPLKIELRIYIWISYTYHGLELWQRKLLEVCIRYTTMAQNCGEGSFLRAFSNLLPSKWGSVEQSAYQQHHFLQRCVVNLLFAARGGIKCINRFLPSSVPPQSQWLCHNV